MSEGTGLVGFSKQHAERFFDVGISEQHAVTFCGGLACRGLKPVAAIYSTFLQRAYDQIIHDIALQNLNVVFALDRGGLVGADGATHHGVFDLAYLRCIPNLVVMAPKDEDELRLMMKTAIHYDGGPIAYRFPRGNGRGVALSPQLRSLPIGRGEILEAGEEILLIGLGAGTGLALDAAKLLQQAGHRPTVLNARFLKPLDEQLLLEQIGRHRHIFTLEEGTVEGFGSAVLELLHSRLSAVPRVHRIGIPDHFIEHGTPQELHAMIGFTPRAVAERVLQQVGADQLHIDLAEERRRRGTT
jgi:1-deoxy-D-xylulose-5-phosphate synthase